MRSWTMFVSALTLALVATPALAAPAPQTSPSSAAIGAIRYGSIEGRVIAMDLKAENMQVAAVAGSATGPMRVTFTYKTIIHQGILHRNPAAIKVGEHVVVTYAGSDGKWVADNIDILEPSVPVAHYLGTH